MEELKNIITKAVKDAVEDVIKLDIALDKINNSPVNSKDEYNKDCYRFDDNLVAIDMLKDVTKIIEGIERNDARDIRGAFQSLKDHTSEFEKVFNYFLATGTYN